MAENKTIATDASVSGFLNAVTPEEKRKDSYRILDLMKEITGQPPVMWGSSVIGFGRCHYKYDSGREGDMMLVGFSPRKQNLALYVGAGAEWLQPLLKKLGKYSTGKSCLYIRRLAEIDETVLAAIISDSYNYYDQKYNR